MVSVSIGGLSLPCHNDNKGRLVGDQSLLKIIGDRIMAEKMRFKSVEEAAAFLAVDDTVKNLVQD